MREQLFCLGAKKAHGVFSSKNFYCSDSKEHLIALSELLLG